MMHLCAPSTSSRILKTALSYVNPQAKADEVKAALYPVL